MELLLDQSIRNIVTLPIFLIAILSNIIRRYLSFILNSSSSTASPEPEEIATHNNLDRAKHFRKNASTIPFKGYLLRRAYFVKPGTGVLRKVKQPSNSIQAMSMNPGDSKAMLSLLQKQFIFIFFSGGVGFLISYLFSGFLVAKSPFPLTYKLRLILQKGAYVPNVENAFVSSFSWYLFILLNSSSLVNLLHYFLGDDNLQDDSFGELKGMVSGGAKDMNPVKDLFTLCNAEIDALNVEAYDEDKLNQVRKEVSIRLENLINEQSQK